MSTSGEHIASTGASHPVLMDERLFEHIFHDASLRGSFKLQGQAFITAMRYMNGYVKTILENPEMVTDELRALSNALDELIGYEAAVTDTTNKLRFDEISEQFSKQVSSLQPGQSAWLPGGYLLDTKGHATLHQVLKDDEGNYFFRCINTGAGLEHHAIRDTKEKRTLKIIFSIKIPKERMTPLTNFKQIITKLLYAREGYFQSSERIDANYFYKRIFKFMRGFLGATLDHSKERSEENHFSTAQISGTCTQQVIFQLAKLTHKHQDDYRRFLYGFNARALDDYWQKLIRDNTLASSDRRDSLEKAIRHQLRLLNLKKTKEPVPSPPEFLFTFEEKEKELQKLTGYLSVLRTRPEPVPTSESFVPLSTRQDSLEFRSTTPLPSTALNTFQSKDYLIVKPILGGESLISDMTDLIKKCKDWELQYNFQLIFDHLDSFILNMPIANPPSGALLPYYSDINTEIKAFEFIRLLNKIQELYLKSTRSMSSFYTLLPREYCAKISLNAITAHINANHRIIGSGKDFYTNFLSPLGRDFTTPSPYLATNDPRLDHRLNQAIQAYHAVAADSDDTFWQRNKRKTEYYLEILNSLPELKALLEDMYQKEYDKLFNETTIDDFGKSQPTQRALELTKVNKAHVEAMYYFLNHQEILRIDIRFAPLFLKFDLQKALEKQHASATRELRGDNFRSSTSKPWLSLSFNESEPILENNSEHQPNQLTIPPSLQRSKYNIQTSYFEDSVSCERGRLSLTDNQIQITKPLKERELFLLRHPKYAQVLLSIDYFKRHLDKLEQGELQGYLEANLFEPGLLLEQLTHHETEFFRVFNAFIEKGLLKCQNKNKQLKPEALFFIRLGYLVHEYALKLDSIRFADKLKSYEDQLNQTLQEQKDPDIRHKIQLYQFQYMVSKQTIASEDELFSLLHAHCCLRRYPLENHKLDKDSTFHYEQLKYRFLKQLKDNEPLVNDAMITRLLTELGLKFKDPLHLHITKRHPIFTITDDDKTYTLNLELGLVFKDNLSHSSLPEAISNHPIMKTLGLHKDCFCLTSADEKLWLIEKPPISLRFIQNRGSYSIQKKWNSPSPPHAEAWYELTPLPGQGDGLQIALAIHPKAELPKLFSGWDTMIWRSETGNTFLVTDEKLSITMEGNTQTGEIISISKEAPFAKLCDNNEWLQKQLSHFESKEFILSWKTAREEYLIQMPRMGIQLQLKKTGPEQAFQLIYELNGIPYVLKQQEFSLGKGVSQLTFQHEEETFCLLAIHPFINTKTRSEHSKYYALTQDIEREVPKHRLNYPSTFWKNNHSVQVMKLKMAGGKPIPSSPEEALYLCYVYLCTHQPSLAWETLETYINPLGGLKGTPEELKYLHWIIDYTPYPLEASDTEEATAHHPENVACKLKALAALAKYTKHTGCDITSKIQQSSDITLNDRFDKACTEDIKKFYKDHPKKIKTLFSELQKMRPELPKSYHLSDAEITNLLDVCLDAQVLPEAGALRYERVQLHFRQLRREWSMLQREAATRQSAGLIAAPYVQQRIKTIEKIIKDHENIARTTSRLEYQKARLQIWDYQTLRNDISEKLKKRTDPIFQERRAAEYNPEFTLGTTFQDLLSHIDEVLSIAITGEHPFKPKLITYCQDVLFVACEDQYAASSKLASLCQLLLKISQAKIPPFDINKLRVSSTSVDKALRSLFDYYAHLPNFTVISIPVLVDDTSSILVTAKELWLETPIPKETILPDVPSTSDVPRIQEWLSEPLVSLRQTWHQLNHAFQMAEPDESLSIKENLLGLEKKAYLAGHAKLQALKTMQAFANENLSNDERLLEISLDAKRLSTQWQLEKKRLEEEILALATLGPEDPILKQAWLIDVQSGNIKALDITTLLTLYFHNDKIKYAEATGLSFEKIDLLHDKLVTYVARGIQAQQAERVIKALNSLESATTEDKPSRQFFLAKVLFSQNTVDVVKDPALSLFQFYDDKLLRTEQFETITRLSTKPGETFDQIIERIIMGGGKSKIILPTIAQKKADGTNLVIIEVPRSSLPTNYADLKANSLKLYHQDVYLFDFNRHMDCSSKRLKILFEEFTDVMLNRQYMVTAGDALQSLELKYIELLDNKPNKGSPLLEEWNEQILWASRLLSLLKNRGDLIIDEIHHNLNIKNKLNYTIGEQIPIPAEVTRHTLELYQFFQYVNIAHCYKPPKGESYTLEQAITHREEFVPPLEMNDIMESILSQLLARDESPLKPWFCDEVEPLKTERKDAIKDYLRGKSTSLPEFIQNASHAMQEQIAYYKEQLTNVLPFTLRRHQGEHYGPTKQGDSPIENLKAIPFTANNVPKERSEFGKYLPLNYTIQSLLVTGIDANVFQILVAHWIRKAHLDAMELQTKTIDETSKGILFHQLTGHQLSEFEEEEEDATKQKLNAIASKVSHHTPLLYEVLNELILPTLKMNPTVLSSNAMNHVRLVRSCQGLSGTPWNYTTYHPSLHISDSSGRANDAYIANAIEQKNPLIRGIDYVSPSVFIESLFSPADTKTNARTIIDICAKFKGIPNKTVAQELAQYIFEHPEQFSNPEPLQYVLFFNEGVLSALKIQADIKNQKPEVIESSEPETISKKLGNSAPTAWFTYYDQENTLGTDIKQGEKSKAFVLIDSNTQAQHFLQGSMRMRELIEGDQTIEMVVPHALENKNYSELMTQMIENEKKQLQQDNFMATIACMKNFIREDLLNRLQQIPEDNILQKYALLQQGRAYFFEEEEQDLFKQFGQIAKLIPTAELFNTLQIQLIEDWKRVLKTTETEVLDETMINRMQEAMTEVVGNALKPGICATHQMTHQADLNIDIEVLKQQQKVQQQMRDVQIEQMLHQDTQTAGNTVSARSSWSFDIYNVNMVATRPIPLLSLQAMCSNTLNTPNFSPRLLVTPNFRNTYAQQKSNINNHMKPVLSILFVKKNDQLTSILLTQEELENFINQNESDGSWWITTTQHTTLFGKPPPNIEEDENYQSLIEQIRFFNGEFNLLLENDPPLNWLLNDFDKKINFFRKYLQTNRDSASTDVDALCHFFTVKTELLQAMSKTPWMDRTKVLWEKTYKFSSQRDISLFTTLANAYQEVTLHCHETLSEAFYEGHPPVVKKHVKQYISQLNTLKEFIQCIATSEYKVFSTEEKDYLCRLCPSLEQFLKSPCITAKEISACFDCLLTDLPFADKLLLACVKNSLASQKYLLMIAKMSKNYDVLKQILDSEPFKIASPERDTFFHFMITNPKTPKRILYDIAPNLRTAADIATLAPLAVSDATLLNLLLNNPNISSEIFQELKSNPLAQAKSFNMAQLEALTLLTTCFTKNDFSSITIEIKEALTSISPQFATLIPNHALTEAEKNGLLLFLMSDLTPPHCHMNTNLLRELACCRAFYESPSDPVHDALLLSITTLSCIPPDHAMMAINKTQRIDIKEKIFDSFLSNPATPIPLLETLIHSVKLTEKQLSQILHHPAPLYPNVSIEILLSIASKTNDPDVLTRILSFPCFKEPNPKINFLLSQLIKRESTSIEILQYIASILREPSLIYLLLEREEMLKADPNCLKAIINNSNIHVDWVPKAMEEKLNELKIDLFNEQCQFLLNQLETMPFGTLADYRERLTKINEIPENPIKLTNLGRVKADIEDRLVLIRSPLIINIASTMLMLQNRGMTKEYDQIKDLLTTTFSHGYIPQGTEANFKKLIPWNLKFINPIPKRIQTADMDYLKLLKLANLEQQKETIWSELSEACKTPEEKTAFMIAKLYYVKNHILEKHQSINKKEPLVADFLKSIEKYIDRFEQGKPVDIGEALCCIEDVKKSGTVQQFRSFKKMYRAIYTRPEDTTKSQDLLNELANDFIHLTRAC